MTLEHIEAKPLADRFPFRSHRITSSGFARAVVCPEIWTEFREREARLSSTQLAREFWARLATFGDAVSEVFRGGFAGGSQAMPFVRRSGLEEFRERHDPISRLMYSLVAVRYAKAMLGARKSMV
ncbi:putative predicted protein [Ralstonia phage RSK1]|uniref:Uncharacterized protein n=1 Tax=Ralstonia phage RSK1 TaxID=1417599 RepID=U6C716_9CAUD|nr:putative predicted protein [Ralstonia phage RSK1]BAO04713.1 putative predicted protein [Ralstonia phage RSK1]